MKKKFIYLIIAMTLINLTALGTIIYQRWLNQNDNSDKSMREARFEQVKHELALTAAQISHFKKVRHEFHTRVDSLNQVLEGINRQLLKEIWQSPPEQGRIDTLLNRIGRLQMESQHLVIRHFYQFKEVLTAAQWQKFYGIVSQRFPGRFRNSPVQPCGNTEEDNQ